MRHLTTLWLLASVVLRGAIGTPLMSTRPPVVPQVMIVNHVRTVITSTPF